MSEYVIAAGATVLGYLTVVLRAWANARGLVQRTGPAALAESTDLDEKLSAALAAGAPEARDPSRLSRMLRTGDADLQETLAASTDVERRLTETLDEAAAVGGTFRES